MLAPIMSSAQIESLPYKDLLYELERRRIFLEKNEALAKSKEMERQLTGKRKSQSNR
jgi:hypothetical protein